MGGDNIANLLFNFNPQTNAALLNWNEFILEIKLNSASGVQDGEYAMWFNGVQVQRITGLSFCCTTGVFGGPIDAWGTSFVRPYAQIQGTAGDGGFIWLDDFSSDTTFNSIVSANESRRMSGGLKTSGTVRLKD